MKRIYINKVKRSSMHNVQRSTFNVQRFCFLLMFAFFLASCEKGSDDAPTLPDTNAEKTLFVYMPWTGTNGNLYDFFQTNISDMKKAIVNQNGLGNKNLMIFISESATRGSLIKVNYANGACTDDTIRVYENTEELNLKLDSQHWITYILNQVKSYAPADTYAMIIGSHGYGWIDADDWDSASAKEGRMNAKARNWRSDDEDIIPTRTTRWFGGNSIKVDVSTLASAISASGINEMQFIMFDDCNMANVETAYALRNVTQYLIACPTEILAYGMPYENIFKYLIATTPDYSSVCSEFLNFYNNYTYNGQLSPYGTISVADCEQIDSLATLMKQINAVDTFDVAITDSLQALDGYDPTIFFDMGSYVRSFCSDATLLALFEDQLNRFVPYKAATEYYYSSLWKYGKHNIKTYSGITISDPSSNSAATTGLKSTAWYSATH